MKIIFPDSPNLEYRGHVAVEKGTSRAIFDRRLTGYTYNLGSSCATIVFKTDAVKAAIIIEYADKTQFAGKPETNSNGVCLVDRAVAVPFTRRSDQGGRQSVEVSGRLPAGVHTYEIILPICDRVNFCGVEVDDGAKFFTPDPAPKTRYVAYGDSITQGFCASDSVHTYCFLLAESKQWQLVNFGFGSRTAVPADGALIPDLKPDIITILLGVNDCLGKIPPADFTSNYQGVLDNIRKGVATVPIYVITPLNLPGKWPGTEDLEEYRNAIRTLVRDRQDSNLHLVEGPDLIPNELRYFQDGLHPNDEGFVLMAKALGLKIRP